MPAFGAITTFNKLRQNYPDYTYREATLNPTNPEHRAADWEADVIGYLRDHPEQKQLNGERETPTGRSMYLATPIAAAPPCLECHGNPAHGSARHDRHLRVQQRLWVETRRHRGRADRFYSDVGCRCREPNRLFHLLIFYLIVILVATIVALDAGVYFIVIRPLKLVSDAADRVSKGETNQPPLPVKGGDEIAAVTASFNRMQLSLAKAFKMLG